MVKGVFFKMLDSFYPTHNIQMEVSNNSFYIIMKFADRYDKKTNAIQTYIKTALRDLSSQKDHHEIISNNNNEK
jgi:menaquinone-dependent protoporphyrinogen IX oxidase